MRDQGVASEILLSLLRRQRHSWQKRAIAALALEEQLPWDGEHEPIEHEGSQEAA